VDFEAGSCTAFAWAGLGLCLKYFHLGLPAFSSYALVDIAERYFAMDMIAMLSLIQRLQLILMKNLCSLMGGADFGIAGIVLTVRRCVLNFK